MQDIERHADQKIDPRRCDPDQARRERVGRKVMRLRGGHDGEQYDNRTKKTA